MSSLEPLLTHLRTQVALFVVPFAVIVGWLLLGLYFFFVFVGVDWIKEGIIGSSRVWLK